MSDTNSTGVNPDETSRIVTDGGEPLEQPMDAHERREAAKQAVEQGVGGLNFDTTTKTATIELTRQQAGLLEEVLPEIIAKEKRLDAHTTLPTGGGRAGTLEAVIDLLDDAEFTPDGDDEEIVTDGGHPEPTEHTIHEPRWLFEWSNYKNTRRFPL